MKEDTKLFIIWITSIMLIFISGGIYLSTVNDWKLELLGWIMVIVGMRLNLYYLDRKSKKEKIK